MRKQGWTWATVPIDFRPYWAYGALDPVLTSYLIEKFRPAVAQAPAAYDLELLLRLVVAHGTRVQSGQGGGFGRTGRRGGGGGQPGSGY